MDLSCQSQLIGYHQWQLECLYHLLMGVALETEKPLQVPESCPPPPNSTSFICQYTSSHQPKCTSRLLKFSQDDDLEHDN
eukprot:5432146-Ditylum_brightwellii.AAC.1